jgi:EpsI family protein
MRSLRFWVVCLLLGAAAVLLRLRGDVDIAPKSEPLSRLSMSIGTWQGRDIPLEGYVLDVLGQGVFLNRTYLPVQGAPQRDSQGRGYDDGPIGLFIGYFPTQRTGQAIHSPQNCLPGAGWNFESKGVTELTDADGKHYRVGAYLISNGKDRDEVLYWYRSHGRSIASDYAAKWYTLTDSILHNRTDAALIRVITPLQPGEAPRDAELRAVSFAEQMNPMLSAYIPD